MNLKQFNHDLDIIRLSIDMNDDIPTISRYIQMMYRGMKSEELETLIKYRQTMKKLDEYLLRKVEENEASWNRRHK